MSCVHCLCERHILLPYELQEFLYEFAQVPYNGSNVSLPREGTTEATHRFQVSPSGKEKNKRGANQGCLQGKKSCSFKKTCFVGSLPSLYSSCLLFSFFTAFSIGSIGRILKWFFLELA